MLRLCSRPIRLLMVSSLTVQIVAAQSPVPRYEVKRTPVAPVIDGELDEPTWAAAPADEDTDGNRLLERMAPVECD